MEAVLPKEERAAETNLDRRHCEVVKVLCMHVGCRNNLCVKFCASKHNIVKAN